MTIPALSIRDLRVDFTVPTGNVSAVDGVSLDLHPGRIMGLVGESGCGKSTLANAVMGLLPSQAQARGSALLDGEEVMGIPEEQLRQLRGDRMSMIFQDPATSLDPTFSVGEQVAETIRAHRSVSRRVARARATEIMASVGIPDAGRRYNDPPHRFSGGMRQRIVIAAALANEPAVLIADEPTTALDVTIQEQILDLLQLEQQRRKMALVIVTHDMGVVAGRTGRVAVMYAGRLVETGSTLDIFEHTRHRYTDALIHSIPRLEDPPHTRLATIPGRPPDLLAPAPGCPFAPRCSAAVDRCAVEMPALTGADGGSRYACWVPVGTPDEAGVGA